MTERLIIPEKTILDQRRAADPNASAWVSANAGAGKTKVLTDRVVRLLLAGSPPGRILCLTFTKAAAANMAIRIFERLGRWVTLDEEALVRELTELEGIRPSRDQVRLARRLFARAVETPGGLKIDTIHAFCERLLHLVPFEANVPARFAVLDEGQADELVAEATANVLADAAMGDRPDLAEALALVSADASGEGFAKAIRCAVAERKALQRRGGLDTLLASLRQALGLRAEDTSAAIEQQMLGNGLPDAEWPRLAETLEATGKKTDADRAAALRNALAAESLAETLEHYLSLFFTDGKPRAPTHIVTKGAGEALKDRLIAEQERLVVLEDRRRAAKACERTGALFTLAAEIDRRVQATKTRLGALDFDDLIERTLGLLSRGDAAWVLYKLDRGIDHILVDEAQDTNPEQWEILRHITADFTAGEGARGATIRTLFAVGDPKQSIYGFQGAAPQEFEASRDTWKRKVLAASLRFEDVELTLSFRSAKAVLSAVDATFAIETHFKGLSFGAVTKTVHESARPEAPGLVELWPVETPADEVEPDAWSLPLDEPEQHAPPVVVSRRVAQAVRAWTTVGDERGRVWRAGDILVLMRRRGPAFEAVIRALKEAGVAVAGQDRLNIGEHIAVLDLVAAGRAALLPEDDLTLATALKSPLVGLNDDDFVRIAADRPAEESLAAALARLADADEAAARGDAALRHWRDLARATTPFGFYATILGPEGGRAKLVARLGSEAGDAIDLFLCAAHQAESGTDAPSLTAFLARYDGGEGDPHTVKRDLDATRDEVRVMTVHGAKGLEAPIVVLIDGCEVAGPRQPLLSLQPRRDGPPLPAWSSGERHDSGVLAAARERLRTAEREEHNRLLYVAMTRAKDRLVIAPYVTGRKDSPHEAWCEMIRRGLVATANGLVLDEAPYGPIEVWRDGAPSSLAAAPSAVAPLEPIAVPAWLIQGAAPEPESLPPVRPSSALAAADRVTRGADGPVVAEARLRGVLVHALLERLPGLAPERRAEVGRAYLAARAPRIRAEDRDRLVADALGVIAHPDLAPLFGPGSRAEAPIAGRLQRGETSVPVSGQIDRLAVTPEAVLVADFKTGARPPATDRPVPAAHVGQLALYRLLLAEIYAPLPVRAYLIWTAGPVIRPLSDAELDAATDAIKQA